MEPQMRKDTETPDSRRLAVMVLAMVAVVPGTALVYLPAILVYATAHTGWAANPAGPAEAALWIGLAVGAAGLFLMAWTIADFVRVGHGTPAPWKPPLKLVERGPYRLVRNPMISGAMLVLAGEVAVLRSPAVAAWLGAFMIANLLYIPLVEEPGLEKRFGPDYRRYKENVPRWVPRATPWTG
ncbi:MAG: isoprenylcysteine carboxylmethyltransferase family protein [Alphaproteobacteria bacterium]